MSLATGDLRGDCRGVFVDWNDGSDGSFDDVGLVVGSEEAALEIAAWERCGIERLGAR